MKSNNRPFFKYLAYVLLIILMCVLQSTPKLLPVVWGSKPFLLLSMALAVTAYEDFIPSVITAAVCGIFADCNSGGTIGYFAISFTIVCALVWSLSGLYLNATLFTFIVTSAAAVVAVLGVHFILFRLIAGVPDAGALFAGHYLSRMGLTLLCAVPLYVVTGFLHRSFTAKGSLY